MRIEEAVVGGWRAVAKWEESGDARVSVELDRNLGGLWPRAIVFAAAQRSDRTTVSVEQAGVVEEEFEGTHGFKYQRGIHDYCVGPLLQGASTGIGKAHGVEIHIESGGVAVDTAELVCRYTAQIAAQLLLGTMTEPRSLESVLHDAVASWSES